MSAQPQYAGQPVILTHVALAGRSAVAACSGEPFYPPRVGSYPGVPQVPCPLCVYFTLFGKVAQS